MGSLKSRTINGIKWTSVSTITTSIVNIIQIAILARYLSKSDFGLFAIALLFLSFAKMFTDMGISSAVMYKKDISKNQYSSVFWLTVLIGFSIYLVLLFISPYISSHYHQKELLKIIPLISLVIIFSSFSKLHITVQQKDMNFKFISIIDIIASIIMFLITVVLLLLSYGLYSLIIATVFKSLFISSIYNFVAIKNRNFNFHFKIKETIPFLKIGSFQLGSGLVDYFSSQMDIIVISNVYSMEILGVYSLCKQLVLKVFVIINPILTKVITPMFTQIQEEKAVIKEKYKLITELLSFINFPIYFLMALISQELLKILYGEQYSSYYIILSLLAINYAILSIGNPLGSLQVALGRTDLGFYWSIFRILTIAVFMFMGSFFSINIFILFILLNNFLNIIPYVRIQLKKMIDISYFEYYTYFVKTFILCVIITIPLYILKINLTLSHIYSSLIVTIIFIIFYFSFSLIFNKRLTLYSLDILKNNFHVKK